MKRYRVWIKYELDVVFERNDNRPSDAIRVGEACILPHRQYNKGNFDAEPAVLVDAGVFFIPPPKDTADE